MAPVFRSRTMPYVPGLTGVVSCSSPLLQAPLAIAAAAPVTITTTRARMELSLAPVVVAVHGRRRASGSRPDLLTARHDRRQPGELERRIDGGKDEQCTAHCLELAIELRRQVVEDGVRLTRRL